MKITRRQLRRIIKEEKKRIAESYNSMSPRSKSLAYAVKRRFAKDYPEVQVGIDGREGWITVNGKKAVNMSQASGSPLSMGDIIDKMKQAYLGHNMEDKYAVLPADDDPAELARHKAYRDSARLPEGKMKITKRQLRRIIREEKQKIFEDADIIQFSSKPREFEEYVREIERVVEFHGQKFTDQEVKKAIMLVLKRLGIR